LAKTLTIQRIRGAEVINSLRRKTSLRGRPILTAAVLRHPPTVELLMRIITSPDMGDKLPKLLSHHRSMGSNSN
jgi:hypothetical protein